MRIACRILLALLGLLMAWSAVEHWTGWGSIDLQQHYADSILGPRGLIGIAIAQTIAAIGLLWPRIQVLTGLILASVMILAAVSHIRADGPDQGIRLPLAIAAWAAVPSLLMCFQNRSR